MSFSGFAGGFLLSLLLDYTYTLYTIRVQCQAPSGYHLHIDWVLTRIVYRAIMTT
jgi:hypothetical protein